MLGGLPPTPHLRPKVSLLETLGPDLVRYQAETFAKVLDSLDLETKVYGIMGLETASNDEAPECPGRG